MFLKWALFTSTTCKLKVCGPYVATLLNWTLVFEWYLARLVLKNAHLKVIYVLARWDVVQKIYTWRDICVCLGRKSIFNLISYVFASWFRSGNLKWLSLWFIIISGIQMNFQFDPMIKIAWWYNQITFLNTSWNWDGLEFGLRLLCEERRGTHDSQRWAQNQRCFMIFLYHQLTNWVNTIKGKSRLGLLYILGFETTRVHGCWYNTWFLAIDGDCQTYNARMA